MVALNPDSSLGACIFPYCQHLGPQQIQRVGSLGPGTHRGVSLLWGQLFSTLHSQMSPKKSLSKSVPTALGKSLNTGHIDRHTWSWADVSHVLWS